MDLMLGDINENFVELLTQLRKLNVHFGFISDQRGMDAHSRGAVEFAALTELLDELLIIREAVPDFWIGSGAPQRSNIEFRYRYEHRLNPRAAMISRAKEWYGIDKNRVVSVGSSATVFAASEAGVAGIHYSGWGSKRNSSVGTGIGSEEPSPPEIASVQRLRAKIQQILELGDRAGSSGMAR